MMTRSPSPKSSPSGLAVDDTVILLHPPLPLVGASIVMECGDVSRMTVWSTARRHRAARPRWVGHLRGVPRGGAAGRKVRDLDRRAGDVRERETAALACAAKDWCLCLRCCSDRGREALPFLALPLPFCQRLMPFPLLATPQVYCEPAPDSGGQASRWRDYHSAATPSPLSRRFNMDGEGGVSKMTELSPTAQARLLRTMTFDEAQELASTGAKVLHPRCIGPAVRGPNTPIRDTSCCRRPLTGVPCLRFGPRRQSTASRSGSVKRARAVPPMSHRAAALLIPGLLSTNSTAGAGLCR